MVALGSRRGKGGRARPPTSRVRRGTTFEAPDSLGAVVTLGYMSSEQVRGEAAERRCCTSPKACADASGQGSHLLDQTQPAVVGRDVTGRQLGVAVQRFQRLRQAAQGL